MVKHVFDACSLINLMATRRSLEIVEALDLEVLVVERTLAECGHLRIPGPSSPTTWEREPIDFDGLRSTSRFTTVATHSVSARERVRFSEQLEDEDALPVALAVDLGLPLVSDDKRVRDVATSLAPTIPLQSTFGVLVAAYGACNWTPPILRRIARDLVDRAAFALPRWDPNAARARAILNQHARS